MTSCACDPADLTCQTEARRAEVRRSDFNGLDYLEVSDDQTMLTVYFLGPAPQGIGIDNVAITGGTRIRDLHVVDVHVCPQSDAERDNCLVVTLDRPGDFATYTLCLVNLPEDARFDPRYLCLCFSFKAACPSDLDCKSVPDCPTDRIAPPEIDYLAKDYASFRQLILDRLAVVMPDWQERHVPDIGITLVELLAYVGDYLSYSQDAVATEAYLGTARQRISVRRHARLVDYVLHEGCNARAWIAVETSGDTTIAASALSFLTAAPQIPKATERLLTWADLAAIPSDAYEVFEPLCEPGVRDLKFYRANNRIRIYTWGNSLCCLPRGATSATLVDGTPPVPPDPDETPVAGDLGDADDDPDKDCDPAQPGGPAPTPGQRALSLVPGDVLIFIEVIGPRTGAAPDADPARRHPVRLTHVTPTTDPLTGQPLLAIAWATEDALPFALCLSVIGPPPDCAPIADVSIALGNVVLADHGRRRRPPQDLGCVPVDREEVLCLRAGRPTDPVRHPGRFAHAEIEGPLTFCAPVDAARPAAALLTQDPRAALPALQLQSWRDPDCAAVGPAAPDAPADRRHWMPRRDLLDSGPQDAHVVVEIDDRRHAHLRFGDDRLGRRPDAGGRFEARYRTGNGPAGNVGTDKLTLAVVGTPVSGLILTPRNPLAATGGTAPEPVADARLFAPHAFGRVRERAVTPADYAEIAVRHSGVQRAAAVLRWNGSWYQVRVAIDPLGRADPTAELLDEITACLHRYRRIGHDLAVVPARYVPLDIVMQICVAPGYLRGHIKAALLQRFGSGIGPNSQPGFFHPDALSFGQSVALSRLVAAAQTLEGVQSAAVTVLERLFEGSNGEIEAGVLPIGAQEVARLDSDPNFPENGRIRFEMRGGR